MTSCALRLFHFRRNGESNFFVGFFVLSLISMASPHQVMNCYYTDDRVESFWPARFYRLCSRDVAAACRQCRSSPASPFLGFKYLGVRRLANVIRKGTVRRVSFSAASYKQLPLGRLRTTFSVVVPLLSPIQRLFSSFSLWSAHLI